MDLLEFYPMVGSRVHELLSMPSSPSAVKKEWHLKDLLTELYVKQMGDGVIHFLGATVRENKSLKTYLNHKRVKTFKVISENWRIIFNSYFQLPVLFPTYRMDLYPIVLQDRVFLMQTQLTSGAYHNSRKPTTQLQFAKMEHGQGFQNAFQVSCFSKNFVSEK